MSQSCIPLVDFQTIYKDLTSTDKGFLFLNNVKRSDHHFHVIRHPQIKNPNFVPFDKFVMHQYEGQCFSREMINFFLKHDNTHLFELMNNSDEHYTGNTLVHYSQENLIEPRNVHHRAYMGGQSKGGLSSVDMATVEKLRQQGKLFMRKLAPNALIPTLF